MSRIKKIVDSAIDYREFESPYTALATMIFVQAVSDLRCLERLERTSVSGCNISKSEILSFLCSNWASFLASSVGIQPEEVAEYVEKYLELEEKEPKIQETKKPDKPKNRKSLDLTGKRFGRLVALERGENYKHKTIYPDGTYHATSAATWVCRCDCGTVKTILATNLISGRQVSCGCSLRKKERSM